jgi:hypothetical protein
VKKSFNFCHRPPKTSGNVALIGLVGPEKKFVSKYAAKRNNFRESGDLPDDYQRSHFWQEDWILSWKCVK